MRDVLDQTRGFGQPQRPRPQFFRFSQVVVGAAGEMAVETADEVIVGVATGVELAHPVDFGVQLAADEMHPEGVAESHNPAVVPVPLPPPGVHEYELDHQDLAVHRPFGAGDGRHY